MQSGSNVVAFPNNRLRDEAIIDLYRRRLAFERRARAGLLTDAEEIQGDMELRARVFAIAREYGL